MNGPAMHQGIPSAGQPIPPQSFIGGQQPMGMLPGAQNPSRAFNMHPGQLPMQQQPQQVVRTANNVLAPRPPPNGPPGAAHMQQGMPGLAGFPGQIMQQPPPGAVRRVPSQPNMNALSGMPPPVGGMSMPLGPGPQTSLPLRQGQPQTPQQQMQAHNQQQRMQAAQHHQQHMFGMHPGMGGPDMASMMRNPSGGGPPSLVRNPSGQVMSSLAQPPPSQGQHPSAIGGPIGGGIGGIGGLGNGMPPPHQTSGNPFPAIPPSQLSPSPRPPSSIVGGLSGSHPHAPHTHPHSHQLSMGGGFPSPGHSVVPTSNNGFLGMASGSAGGPLNMSSGPHHTMGGALPQGARQPGRTTENGMSFSPYGTGSGPSQSGAGRPGGNVSNPYTFPPSSSPPIPLSGDAISTGGTPNRNSFPSTPAPQFEVNSTSGVGAVNAGNVNATAGGGGAAPGQGTANNMSNSNGNSNISSDLYQSFNMPPPSSIPPRPGSQTPQLQQQQAAAQHQQHQINQHQHQQLQQHLNQQQQQLQHPLNSQHQQHPSQQHPTHALPPSHSSHTPHTHHHQLQQQATQHASPPSDVTMGGMYPPRPHSQPQRPPSQASRGTPRTTGTPLPGSSMIPNSNGPGTSNLNGNPGGNTNPNASSAPTPSLGANHLPSSNHNANLVPNTSSTSSSVNTSSSFSSSAVALGGTPLTQTGIRQQPMFMNPAINVGAMAGMGNIGTGGMGMGNIRPLANGPSSGSISGMGSMGMGNVGTIGQGHPPGGINSGGSGAPGSGGLLPHIAPRPPIGAVSTGPQSTPSGPAPSATNGGTSNVPTAAPTAPVPAPTVQRPFGPAPSSALGIGQGLVRLLQFSGILASELKTKLKLHWWQDLVKEYFTPNATMKLTLWRDSQRNEAKPFEIGVPILPRFFLVTTQSGVKSMSLTLDGARERSFGQGHSVVECVSAIWTYRYTNGYTITLRGPLTVHVIVTMSTPGNSAQTLRFEEFQFDANLHDKYISIEAISGTRTVDPGGPVPSSDEEEEEDMKWEEPRVFISQAVLAGEPVNAFGIPQATMRCLELAESVSSMADLIEFAHDNKMGPLDALRAMANRLRASNQAAAQQQQHQQHQQQQHHQQPPQHYLVSTSGPSGSALPAPSSSTTLDSFAPSYSQPPNSMTQSNTLYSSAPSSVTNPQQSGPTPGPPSNMNSPGTASSSGNSPEKQLKSIPQSNQQGQPQASGSGSGGGQQQGQTASASSPAMSSGGTTNTPALSNTSLKRKHQGDASSPTVTNSDQPKRPSRKKGRTSTSGAPG